MKKNSVQKKGSIADDMERLKQRRDDRKVKNSSNDPKSGNVQAQESLKTVDPEYEKLIKKKKIVFDQEPDSVIIFISKIIISTSRLKQRKFL